MPRFKTATGGKQATEVSMVKFRLGGLRSGLTSLIVITTKGKDRALRPQRNFCISLPLFLADLRASIVDYFWGRFHLLDRSRHDTTGSFLARSCARYVLSRYVRDENRPVRFHFCFRAFLTSHDRWKYEDVLWRKYRQCIFVRPCDVSSRLRVCY